MSDLWCQIMADVLDREIHRVVEPRACNARGAALLASLGLNYLQVEDIPSRVGIERRSRRRPSTESASIANLLRFWICMWPAARCIAGSTGRSKSFA